MLLSLLANSLIGQALGARPQGSGLLTELRCVGAAFSVCPIMHLLILTAWASLRDAQASGGSGVQQTVTRGPLELGRGLALALSLGQKGQIMSISYSKNDNSFLCSLGPNPEEDHRALGSRNSPVYEQETEDTRRPEWTPSVSQMKKSNKGRCPKDSQRRCYQVNLG